MRIALTGVTGLIGRNLFFEILKKNLNCLNSLEIFIFGRSQKSFSLKQRIIQIISEDGLLYIDTTKDKVNEVKDFCENKVKYIEIDLECNNLGIKAHDYNLLSSFSIDIFYHVAALTDLRDFPGIYQELKKTNIYGTQQILNLVSNLKVKQFCYVGTAYSCGSKTGDILPDIGNINDSFRSPYEKTKLEAEIFVRNFAKTSKMKFKFFRPSVTCGRLIEKPLGSINKFDVFYGWGSFFLQLKLKKIKHFADRYNEPIHMGVRTCYNKNSGLNIVPADYAAKILYEVCVQDDPGDSYHLVNDAETPHVLYMSELLRAFNISGVCHVDSIPKDMTRIEKLYYKTAGRIFTPYINAEPMLFNTNSLRSVCKKSNIKCPAVDAQALKILVNYAIEHDFGLF